MQTGRTNADPADLKHEHNRHRVMGVLRPAEASRPPRRSAKTITHSINNSSTKAITTLSVLIGLGIMLTSTVGCVERKLSVTSDPPGALIYMNDREIGRTPLQTDFTWYGDYDVQVRKAGFETIKTAADVKAPWWQWVPIDLFAELAPWYPTDRQSLHFSMTKLPENDTPPADLIKRAGNLKEQLEDSRTQ